MDLKIVANKVLESHNYVFLFTNLVLLRDYVKGTLATDMKRDKFLRFLVWSYLCFLLHCLLTIVVGQDDIRFATAVLRTDISGLLLYFIARKLSMSEVKVAFRNICFITVIHCAFYFLQYIGLNLFVEENHLDASSTLRNGTPPALPLLLLFSLFILNNRKFFVLFLIPIFTGAARGMLVALVAAIALFYRKHLLKPKCIIPVVISILVLYGGYNHYLADDYQRYDVSFAEEIAKGFDYKTLTDYSAYAGHGNQMFSFKDNGTFAFRISMVLERFIYLLNNPQYLPFGIGMVAEESPHNNYNFFLGTANENSKNGYCMIASNDIVWSSVILRYGLFGIVFWLLFFLKIKRIMSLRDTSVWAQVGYIYLMFCIFNSFGSDAIVRSSWLLPFYLLISYCQKEKKLYASINHNSDI